MFTSAAGAARPASTFLALSAALALAACSREAQSAPAAAEFETASIEAPAQPMSEAPPVEPAPEAALVPVVEERPAQPAAPRPAAPRATTPAPRPASTPAAPARARAFLAAGTEIAATVDEELTTEKSVAGDRFHATVADDVLGANGEVLLPKGAVVNGRVAESRESGGANDPAVLRLEVESVMLDGRTLTLPADVVEVEAEIGARDSGQKTAVKVVAGAVAGAVIGRILGGDKSSAAKGAVAGAAVGTAAALATKDGQAVIKPGARMVVKLTDRLVVEP